MEKVCESGFTTRLKGRPNKSVTSFLPSHRRLDFMPKDVEALNEKLRERNREKGRRCLPQKSTSEIRTSFDLRMLLAHHAWYSCISYMRRVAACFVRGWGDGAYYAHAWLLS